MALRAFVLFSALFITSFSFRTNTASTFYWCSDPGPLISRPAFLFEPQLANTPQWSPLYLTNNYLFDESWNQDSATVDDNIGEWRRYFGDTIPEPDIYFVIYKAEAKSLIDVQVKSRFRQSPILPSLETNRLVHFLLEKPDPEFIAYLVFTKLCDPYVRRRGYWEQDTTDNTNAMIALAKQGEQAYDACKSPLLKLRYGYQVVRLYRYIEDWDFCVESYDRLVAPLNVESIIRFWALEQKAGALYQLNRFGEGAYLFSKVFRECPSRRITSYASFRIPNDTVWEECVKLCKTQKEKTTLFFLRGLNPRNSVLDEMKNIYSIDPGSDYLNLFLSRAINEIEENIFHADPMGYPDHYEHFKRDTIGIRTLHEFIDMCVLENKVQQRDAWTLASSYFQFLNNDKTSARKTLARLQATVQSENIRQVIPRFEAYYNLASVASLNDAIEDTLFQRIQTMNYEKLQEFTIKEFQRWYTTQGDTIKAFLCDNDLNDLKLHLNLDMTELVIRWWNKKNRTSFDQFLADNRFYNENSGYPYYTLTGAQGLNGLLEIKGAILLGQNKLQDAYEVLKLIPENEQWKSKADPFSIKIQDCRDCEFEENSPNKYSHSALAGKILEYEQMLRTDPQHAAQYHYLLGNAYYNISYFGNAGEALVFHRDCDRIEYYAYRENQKTGIIPFDMDCSGAQDHYVKAMKLAEAAKEYELAAECCFMAAKCEQNTYFASVYERDKEKPIKNAQYRTYFKLMKEKFQKTNFYAKAVRECKYFNYFVSR